MNDEREYFECDTCGYGVSGPIGSHAVANRLDAHEADNPGHRMKEVQ